MENYFNNRGNKETKRRVANVIRHAAVMLMCAFVLVGAVMPFGAVGTAYATTALPTIEAEGACVVDLRTGEILYNKNMYQQFEPASMTKMMTCILALENLQLTDMVSIDAETSFTGGSRIYLIEDEQISVQNLLYALMLESANDAAVALAKAVAGSVQDFANMMNAKAKELGCLSTNFINPNSLHEEGHLSTPYDMALIGQYCMKNKTFRELIKTYKYTIPETNKQPERYMYNTNRLIYDRQTKVTVNGVMRECKYDGCLGGKTGYTPQAGASLTCSAKSYDTQILSVVMKSSDLGRFADTITLFDWTFANYHSELAVEEAKVLGKAPIKDGAVKEVPMKTAEAAYVLLPAEASSALIKTEVVLNEDLTAPIAAGQVIGKLDVYEGDDYSCSVDIIASQDVGKGTVLSKFGIENTKAYIIMGVVGFFVILFVVLFVMVQVEKARRRKARRIRREQRALEIAQERAEREKDQQLREWFFK